MKKNVSGQVIGAQMVSAADGSAFLGNVDVYITIDNGTQFRGNVGSPNNCVNKGNGLHIYLPTQAETNGDHIAFTFIGTGAVPATIQVYTGVQQTADVGALVSGGAVAANVTRIDSDADAAANAKRVALGTVTGTVGTGSTTTLIVTNGIVPASNAADQFKGRIVTFDKNTTTASLRGQSTDITASANAGSPATGTLTVTALTSAPQAGDTFTIT